MPTKQETFDTVVAHLRQQGRKAEAPRKSYGYFCTYRSPDGRKCAAGCLIPDDEYDSVMEGKFVHDPGVVRDCIERHGHDVKLVRALQVVHDADDVSAWERALELVAEEHCLTYTPPAN